MDSTKIRLTFCLKRLASLSPKEFQQYWKETHGPLVEKHRDALRFERYAQLHALEDSIGDALSAVRAAPAPFDGVAEMIWTSRADLEEVMSSKEGQAAGRELLEDERRFIDLSRSPIWLNVESVVLTANPRIWR